ncbi:MAG: sialate O-acetylesterase, partial [Verrucomicrobiota bacterium]
MKVFRRSLVLFGLSLGAWIGWSTEYYLDAVNGDDANSGFSELGAWRSLEKASENEYMPGDRLLLRAGQRWAGALILRGSGAEGNPIVVSSYGEGARPAIDGDGVSDYDATGSSFMSCAIRLFNQSHWRIENLEITNYNPAEENGLSLADWEARNISNYAEVLEPEPDRTRKLKKSGILVQAMGEVEGGILAGLEFKNLEIHGINGDMGNKDNGGIFIKVYDDGMDNRIRFDDVRFEGNIIRDVDRTGISNRSDFDQRSLLTNENWTPNRSWAFSNNHFERTGANALIVRVAEDPVMEYNLFDTCSIKGSGNAAFNFNTDGALWQFNEFRFTKANEDDEDAGGVDSDYRSKHTLIQFNYLHNNDFGMLVTGGPGRFNEGTIVRENLFVNEGRRERKGGEGRFAIRVSGSATNTLFYRNTILLGEDQSEVKVFFHKKWGTWPERTIYRENVVVSHHSTNLIELRESRGNRFVGNRYFGEAIQEPAAEREVYLLIGQSNMAGRAPIELEDEEAIEGCLLWGAEGGWEPATNPLNRYSSIRKSLSMQQLGPGYSFAKRLRELRLDMPLGLVVNARGGTKIEEWEKGSLYFEEAIKRALEASATGRLAGIVWHQGESNSDDLDYLQKLVSLVEDLREALGEPHLPFVAGMVEGDRFVNTQIAQLPDALAFCGVASSEGIETFDASHFDSEGARIMGVRMAETMAQFSVDYPFSDGASENSESSRVSMRIEGLDIDRQKVLRDMEAIGVWVNSSGAWRISFQGMEGEVYHLQTSEDLKYWSKAQTLLGSGIRTLY